jgi:hypothetical protein
MGVTVDPDTVTGGAGVVELPNNDEKSVVLRRLGLLRRHE